MSEPLISLLLTAFVSAVGLVFLWPERGLFWQWHRTRQMTERVLIEDALKHILESERNNRCPTPESVAASLHITLSETVDLLSQAEARELLQIQDDRICLTTQGQEYALQILRAHRLWERYLADETGFPEDEWHKQAHYYEHRLSPTEINDLSSRLGNPTHDPHGDPIPTADGKFVPHNGQLLTEMAEGEPARIVHLEDEPATVYAQLVAEGLRPGMRVRVIENTPQRVRFWTSNDEHVLAPVVAENISVIPLPQSQEVSEPQPTERLSELKSGQKAKVVGISPICQGNERRRLMDLGIIPGTLIEAEMTSPSGDPTAYRIRGAMIALRQKQAKLINIMSMEEAL